jgi:uncharacterized membrane protein
METRRGNRVLLWTGVFLLVLIGVASVTRRAVFLESVFTGHSPPDNHVDAGFARHPVLTLVHIGPGLLFMLLGPLQFMKGLRQRKPALHRWTGRIFLVCAVVGVSALVMAFLMPIGGFNETAAVSVFALLFLFALAKAFLYIRRREVARHREWMIRAFAIGLAVSTIRPIVGIFFATSRLTHLSPHEFFGTAFWLGLTLQTIAAEVYLRSGYVPSGTRSEPLPTSRSAAEASFLRHRA